MTKQELSKKLKKEFFGIDKIIDQIMDLLVPWNNAPECYIRPLICNLWGMTGVGKTTLIRRISELLNIKIIEIDAGMLSDKKNFYISYV